MVDDLDTNDVVNRADVDENIFDESSTLPAAPGPDAWRSPRPLLRGNSHACRTLAPTRRAGDVQFRSSCRAGSGQTARASGSSPVPLGERLERYGKDSPTFAPFDFLEVSLYLDATNLFVKQDEAGERA